MKKIINDKTQIVEDAINGLIKSHPKQLKRLEGFNVILRAEKKQNKVALISGGGSGHEPAHAGFVGEGMLDAAVLGSIFSSPTPDQVLAAIKAADAGAGVLVIIKNYSGDVMNFEMAMELAAMEGITCDKIIVNDDVAVENSTYTTGRRGIAGTILVHKICGQLAEEGKSLAEIVKVAHQVNDNIYSMGMSVSSCTNPEVGTPMFTMADDEMEIGMGIHGEPGVRREKLKSSKLIVTDMLDTIFKETDFAQQEVVVIINGLSSTPMMELYVISSDVHDYLSAKNVKVVDTKVGEYMTSLDMAGFSITLIKLDSELKRLYFAETKGMAW